MNTKKSPDKQKPVPDERHPEIDIELTRLRERPVEITSNPSAPRRPLIFDPQSCTGCNICVELCPIDVLVQNPEPRGIPLIIFPDECWYCGCCEMQCPHYEEGAIRMNFPLMQRVRWKRKKSGEHFRLGMKNPPSPNLRKPV